METGGLVEHIMALMSDLIRGGANPVYGTPAKEAREKAIREPCNTCLQVNKTAQAFEDLKTRERFMVIFCLSCGAVEERLIAADA
jgi:hypothetical protein